MKNWFIRLLALVAAVAFPLGLKAQDGPVFSVKIKKVEVVENSVGVASINVVNGGSGYTVTPVVTFTGSATTPATAFAYYEQDSTNPGYQRVAGVVITNPGAGYTSNPVVELSSPSGQPGTGAQLEAIISHGYVVAVSVLNKGSGYLVPKVTVSAAEGYGAVAAASVNAGGNVTAINMVNAGERYMSIPTVSILDPKGVGSGATANAIVGYKLSSINLQSGGAGYKSEPKVTFPTVGRGASGRVCVSGGKVTGVVVANAGFGYVEGSAVTISAPNADRTLQDIEDNGPSTTATGILHVDDEGKIVSIEITDGGVGYTSVPVAFACTRDGGNNIITTRFLTPIIDPVGSGSLSYITFGEPGAYLTVPEVVIDSATTGITDATATGAIGFSVVSVSVTKASSATWLNLPAMSISAPEINGGEAASLRLITEESKITSVRLVSPGWGYIASPTISFTGGTVIKDGVSQPATTEDYPTVTASIGSGFSDPFQMEAYGPVNVPVVISALAQGTFPVGLYTYRYTVNGKYIGTALPVPIEEQSSAAWAPPEPGVYFFQVEASDGLGNSAKSLTVRYHATGTAFISPMDNTLVPEGSSVVLQASAVGKPNGINAFVKYVEFIVDGDEREGKTFKDESYPYSLIYRPDMSTTRHVVEARAYDNNGNQISPNGSALMNLPMVYVPIGSAPTVRITSPVSGTALSVEAVSAGIPVQVFASSTGEGRVSKVELYVDGVLNNTVTTYPYNFTWKPTAAGSYKLTALVYDDKNNCVASDASEGVDLQPRPTTITVATNPKAVWKTGSAPTSGTAGTPLTFVATAQVAPGKDVNGDNIDVSEVRFVIDDIIVATVPASQAVNGEYTYIWSNPTSNDGPYSVKAVVVDTIGLQGSSEVLSVVIASGNSGGGGTTDPENAAPVVAITRPASPLAVDVGSPVAITATASDSDGSIAKVRFFLGSEQLGADDASYPYNLIWTPNQAGTFSIRALAIDNKGKQTYSEVLTVNVSNPSEDLPAISISAPSSNYNMEVGTEVSLLADATDSTSVSSVQFFINGKLSGSLNSYPYTYAWTPANAGNYTVTAWATDDVGNVNVSDPILVKVAAPAVSFPSVSIGSPASGAVLKVGVATTVLAIASDTDGTVSTVQFYVNGVAQGISSSYPYSTTWTPATPGTYRLSARAIDNQGNQTLSSVRTVTVEASVAPVVSIASPANASALSLGSPVRVLVNATDDIAVESVSFLVNGKVTGSSSVYPFTFEWTPTTPGIYTLTATAIDREGNVTTSSPSTVSLTAGAAPSVSLTNPSSSRTGLVGLPVLISANATDDIAVEKVEFFINGVLKSSVVSYPYTYAWTPLSEGKFTIVARATDSVGNQTDSASVVYTADRGLAPSVSLTSPSSAALYTSGSTVQLTATATDADDTIKIVRFLVNGVEVASLSEAPYSKEFVPASAGVYSVVAEATDTVGNVTTSAARSFTVLANSLPTVTLLAPTANMVMQAGASLTLKASAVDADGTVKSLEYIVDGISATSMSSLPYTFSWTPTSEGIHSIVARATDNAGGIGLSNTVYVKVVNADILGQDLIYTEGTGAALTFSMINSKGTTAAFIGFNATTGDVYRYVGITLDEQASGLGQVFEVKSGASTVLSGQATDAGLTVFQGAWGSGSMSVGLRSVAVGSVPYGLYNGTVTGRSSTDVTAIVTANGVLTVVVVDGSFSDAGRATVNNTTGAFTVNMKKGSKLTGTLDLSTGFITASLTGSVSGSVLLSNSTAAATDDGSLRNVSSRGITAPGKNLTVGFVVGGDTAKTVLVRAVGPKLSSYGVPGVQADPTLKIHSIVNGAASLVAVNDNWDGNANVAAVTSVVRAFALDSGSKDAALVLTLQPGLYTAEASAASDGSGVTLVELYDVDNVGAFQTNRLVNLSANGEVGVGADSLHAGFVVAGDTTKKVLIRAVGAETFGQYVANPLADPVITVRRLVGDKWVDVRQNDNSAIGNDPKVLGGVLTSLGEGVLKVLSNDTKSSELVITLPAGTYTAEVTSGTGAAGTALVEIYEVP